MTDRFHAAFCGCDDPADCGEHVIETPDEILETLRGLWRQADHMTTVESVALALTAVLPAASTENADMQSLAQALIDELEREHGLHVFPAAIG